MVPFTFLVIIELFVIVVFIIEELLFEISIELLKKGFPLLLEELPLLLETLPLLLEEFVVVILLIFPFEELVTTEELLEVILVFVLLSVTEEFPPTD